MKATNSSSEKKKVVIVGGSFAGSTLARLLPAESFDITVIDKKEYFEYVPGVLRCFVEPSHAKSILVPHSETAHGKYILTATVTNIDFFGKTVTLDTGKSVPYDYLCMCHGTDYPDTFIKTKDTKTHAQREKELREEGLALKKAKNIVIVGGGAVGVELAAEFAQQSPSKRPQITLVSAQDSLLAELPSDAGEYALNWLKNHGVKVIFSQMAEFKKSAQNQPQVLLKGSGELLTADRVFNCTGMRPIPITGVQEGALPSKWVPVDAALRVLGPNGKPLGDGNVFAAGDCMAITIPDRPLARIASNAEFTAGTVARNLLRLEKLLPRMPMPMGAECWGSVCWHGLEEFPTDAPLVMCVSLGKLDGILCFNSIILGGGFVYSKMAAATKMFIEWSKMNEVRGGKVGKTIWTIGDNMAFAFGKIF
eukprot:TRINITY_DN20575_c0_g1::TRINITY_DN20575_c0_g1_i1::g.12356::m.12356 TRINITY_DN20575_c0_g1::TRINITY_DN20575_c0_g1_i1::g.12356  ORF type:complete len:422 (-),score=101.75,sp/Q54NS8/AIFB_DICDI/25.68/2e-20,Pyr_redox/PF00070.22/2.5,Pyr_redox/PF00070.22/1.1e-10,Pyr_redox/PF00070.22/3.7e+03,Pyr_redox_2/PF07992.9/9.7e-11,DAO/PF01266.19/0.1,DAO/PF01266.19/0.24,DAO/PF01266.19/4.4,Trp_halogenase/PF04820.9/0.74,Trp_halogenase/PF04820.9/0.38,Trp_halogenase/PF04820.9/0.42,NAD_binding_9/PF13454.1/66,NAD_binding_